MLIVVALLRNFQSYFVISNNQMCLGLQPLRREPQVLYYLSVAAITNYFKVRGLKYTTSLSYSSVKVHQSHGAEISASSGTRSFLAALGENPSPLLRLSRLPRFLGLEPFLQLESHPCSISRILLVFSHLFVRGQTFYFFLNIFFKGFICLFLEGGEGREKERERNINVWLPPTWPPLGTWPSTQAYALMGNRSGNPWVHSLCSIH